MVFLCFWVFFCGGFGVLQMTSRGFRVFWMVCSGFGLVSTLI